MKKLDRIYRDPRGIHVRVILWDEEKQKVTYMRANYEHPCAQSLKQFRKKFTRVL